ncbi:hypothetical protein ACJRO7_027762 [Eucalyptus globulus]|uniref:Uncharacterized protein n=1 Tax=Eucalyptus globulus TaxID=34317 RepID=A0ABD3K2E3_EUCGL
MVIHKLLLRGVVLGAFLGPYHNHITEAVDSMTKPGCRSTCGNLSIPYPFGSDDSDPHCRIDSPSFRVVCDNSTDPPVPYINARDGGLDDLRILNISLENHEMRVSVSTSEACYDSSGHFVKRLPTALRQTIFPISRTKNKFTAIGCDTSAYFINFEGNVSFGCMSMCSHASDVSDGSCSGVGCCETSIPKNSSGYGIYVGSISNHTRVVDFNPCSYAFIAETSSYNFWVGDLKQLKFNESILILDWAIGKQTCEDAKKNSTGYMCKSNTACADAENGFGYKCTCLEGYQGNPYLAIGCHDIDECADPKKNPCQGKCHNIVGNYTCSCPKGYHGNGEKGSGDEQGCTANPSHLMEILVGVAGTIIVLVFSIGFLYLGHKKMKLIRLKEQYFRQNGGLLLQQQLDELNKTTKATKIFSAEELEKATNNYDESRIVGRGGYGTVYKGLLPNDMEVAIKKSKFVDRSQIQQFINEVIVLSQINHRNVVKLLGCCLETEVPLLVYEFVNNGTLFDHIHNPNKSSKLSWKTRLRIASETAEVLSYLHSATSIPIIHRDVKSANILLDANYTAKVSDFGASRLVPLDQTKFQLTEKSDVYSFGVVLVELLTGKKALSFERPEEERSLSMYFLSSLENDNLFHIVEEAIANEGIDEQVREVANLAKRCLTIKGEERPTMKEIASELEGLRAMANHSGVSSTNVNGEEMIHLLGENTNVYMDIGETMNTEYTDCMEDISCQWLVVGDKNT